MMTDKKVTWSGTGRSAQCQPNPSYPEGMDVDLSNFAPSCRVDVPYPAPEIGVYLIECSSCGKRVAITAAGRADDPRSVKIACRGKPEMMQ